ncbi:MAG: glycine/betaine ABC transporter, partial [Marinovum sp.]|nr:glycine/betaine ABC transporter [Marinovum sp.]
MSEDTVIEISNVWKIFGERPEAALRSIRDEGLSKA